MSEPDSPLLRIARGDPDAPGACIARHGPLVWALARREVGGCHADAEDLVQEIFIELWTHAGRFDPTVATEATFVAMIARRRLIDRRRKRSRTRLELPLTAGLATSASGPEAAVDRRDEAEEARRGLDQLATDQRRVLLLAIDDGLTYDQIAQRTGMPLGTVKTHARRALIRLRAWLAATGHRTAPTISSSSSPSPRTEGAVP